MHNGDNIVSETSLPNIFVFDPTNEGPNLRVLHEETTTDGNEQAPQLWLDVSDELVFSEHNVFGTNTATRIQQSEERFAFGSKLGATILPTSSESRLRNVISAIRSIEDYGPMALHEMGDKQPDVVLKSTRDYLTTKATIHGRKAQRKDHYDPREPGTQIWFDLTKENHPVVQAFGKIYGMNEERKLYNIDILQPELRQPVLTKHDLDELALNLIYVVRGETLKQMYSKQLNFLKTQPTPEIPENSAE